MMLGSKDPCDCYACTKREAAADPEDSPIHPRWMRMILCNECGNKRCPHATDHELACTGSNAPGQRGSLYE